MAAVVSAFERTVDEGIERLGRTTPVLLATGTVGGIDVGLGVFALFLVLRLTGSTGLSALAFGIGFVALLLAQSELFTENFLVPITPVVAGKAPLRAIGRLWAGACASNLAGGWVLMAVVVAGFPQLDAVARRTAEHYVHAGISLESFCTALLGGTVITLMTWMEHSTESVGAKIVAAVITAFLLAAGSLNHVIVMSLECFAALQAGAPFGYLTWAELAAWALFGNLVGGLGLVTILRLVQVGGEKLKAERARPAGVPRDEEAPQPVLEVIEDGFARAPKP
ncbi:MAG: formate/nitrite transporter family protein [Acidimicrobiales bacterium]